MRFLSYINGISYVFEAFMVNEFTYDILCAPTQIVPFNAVQNAAYQTCAFQGNTPGSLSVPGAAYLSSAFGYSHSHLWRNFGVVIAFTVLYLVPTIIASEYLPFAGGGGGFTVFAKTKNAKRAENDAKKSRKNDPEAGAVKAVKPGEELALVSSNSDRTARSESGNGKGGLKDLDAKPVFTWKDVRYTVNGKDLLNGIDGYVKPGEMTSLMGISGAGKTTVSALRHQFMTMLIAFL